MLTLGLMSGTSMDGIDGVIIETDGNIQLRELKEGCYSLKYDDEFQFLLRAVEFSLHTQAGNLAKARINFPSDLKEFLAVKLNLSDEQIKSTLNDLNHYLQERKIELTFDGIIKQSTLLHALVVQALLKKLKLTANQIDAIGYHGQTLYHYPAKKITHQLGDAKLLAELTGIAVIYNFRENDIAHGGQGAPLAPLLHRALVLRDEFKLPIAVVNCGGISNLTFIENESVDVLGFDTGPGNCLIDSFVRLVTKGIDSMDKNGQFGKLGSVHPEISDKLYQTAITKKDYFDIKPPKSLDYNDMALPPELNQLSFQDACRTLEAFTADTIVRALDWLPALPFTLILAGGGWHNPVILQELQERIQLKYANQIRIFSAEAVGWTNQTLEAQIFAYFAARSLLGLPLSVPRTTGVIKPMSGGMIALPSLGATEKVMKLLESTVLVTQKM